MKSKLFPYKICPNIPDNILNQLEDNFMIIIEIKIVSDVYPKKIRETLDC
jgi:hypothetical protein